MHDLPTTFSGGSSGQLPTCPVSLIHAGKAWTSALTLWLEMLSNAITLAT